MPAVQSGACRHALRDAAANTGYEHQQLPSQGQCSSRCCQPKGVSCDARGQEGRKLIPRGDLSEDACCRLTGQMLLLGMPVRVACMHACQDGPPPHAAACAEQRLATDAAHALTRVQQARIVAVRFSAAHALGRQALVRSCEVAGVPPPPLPNTDKPSHTHPPASPRCTPLRPHHPPPPTRCPWLAISAHASSAGGSSRTACGIPWRERTD